MSMHREVIVGVVYHHPFPVLLQAPVSVLFLLGAAAPQGAAAPPAAKGDAAKKKTKEVHSGGVR